ncbi:DENN (AEX-3) domain protein (macronuclear) [Tetrahymena thermophila SB210]|uniref:DENN (AEX-3) domain protein n=1 Tax=Tetrahymena thermophila (strain SB210) TaxID=312017 RepID=Q22ZD2_TETTS|nr:DENN (AEX-3) domain protein [Tetrahymena thermophila SB210]EAR90389.1 DENN (AEX-3) domain protein [Tetrahymena thermophila SB210]|eukprot:XP_001010634.1 DENN (AEX-3) domain protein [Tetrahymena thermophila SB210]
MDSNNQKVDKVFENFLVMGVNTQAKDITYEMIINKQNDLSIDVIDIVPNVPQKDIPHYILGMKEFLFPDGLKIYDDKLKVINCTDQFDTLKLEQQFCKQYEKINQIHRKDIIFHFVSTDEYKVRRYCTALIFHEKFYIKNDYKYTSKKQVCKSIPKIPVGQIIKNPLILDEDTDVIYIPKAICLISRLPFFQCQRQFLYYYYHNIIMGRIIGYRKRIIPVPNKMINIFNGLILQSGVKMAEKIWDSHYYQISQQLDKDIAIQYKVKENHLSEFYLSYIFHLMNIVDEDVSFSLYRCYKLDQVKTEDLIFKFKFSSRETLSPENVSYGPLLKRNLTQINLLKIIKNILLERFIIIFSSSPGETACLTESILKLIQPLSHVTTYVPFTSFQNHLDKLLESLGTSAIIGFSQIYKQQVLEKLNEIDKSQKQIVIVDLDENTVEEDAQFNIQLPQRPKEKLIKDLTLAEQEFKSSRDKNTAWEKAIVEIQKAFFNFVLYFVNNVTEFFYKEVVQQIHYASEEELNAIKNDKYYLIDDKFDKQSYLKIFPLEDQVFMREFIYNTMMFSYFIQQMYEVIYLRLFDKKSILEFNQSLDMVKKARQYYNENLGIYHYPPYIEFDEDFFTQELYNSQNQFISKIINQKEEQLSIYPYLVKWLKYLELYEIEKLDGKKKQIKQTSFWQRFWSENILHFVNAEQRQQNRNQLNNNTTLYKTLDQKKFLDLSNIFQEYNISNQNLSSIRIKLNNQYS